MTDSGLSPELRALPDDARRLWNDASERRRAIEAIVEAADSGGPDLTAAVQRVDSAIAAGLQAVGLARGPVQGIVIEAGVIGPYGRKDRDCSLVLFGDRMKQLLAHSRGPDTTFKTWVHESIHARQPYPPGHEREYRPHPGYEEGMAEGLARSVVRGRAGLEPLETSYRYYIAAYAALASVFQVDLEQLWRRAWKNPLGAVRSGFVEAVDQSWHQSMGRAMSAGQGARLQGVADLLFGANRMSWAPSEDAMLTLWQMVLR